MRKKPSDFIRGFVVCRRPCHNRNKPPKDFLDEGKRYFGDIANALIFKTYEEAIDGIEKFRKKFKDSPGMRWMTEENYYCVLNIESPEIEHEIKLSKRRYARSIISEKKREIQAEKERMQEEREETVRKFWEAL